MANDKLLSKSMMTYRELDGSYGRMSNYAQFYIKGYAIEIIVCSAIHSKPILSSNLS